MSVLADANSSTTGGSGPTYDYNVALSQQKAVMSFGGPGPVSHPTPGLTLNIPPLTGGPRG